MQTVLFLALVGCVLVELADACKSATSDPDRRKKREAESPAASDPGYPHPINVHNDHSMDKREAERAAVADESAAGSDSRPSR